MRIIIRNNTQISNKYVRFIKWKLYEVQRKFKQLIYAEVFINKEGISPEEFSITIRLGVKGNDIIIQRKSKDLGELFRKTSKAIHRYLNKNKSVKYKKRNEFFHKKTYQTG